ncbi:MAG: tRNA (N6-threonylcarbamoyladenosine(37)-N6)-methyltransferase TrmO [Vulcanibacillus sp.]
MELKPIGVITSSYNTKGEAPRQGRLSDEIQEIKIYQEYVEGLEGIDNNEYIIILYWQDKSDRSKLITKTPTSGNEERGVFSSRSPNRPNPIAFCIAQILETSKDMLLVKGLDALNGSYVLDIKPYIVEIDCINTNEVKRTVDYLENIDRRFSY